MLALIYAEEKKKSLRGRGGGGVINLVLVFSRWIEMQTFESGRHPVHIFLSLSFSYRGGSRPYKVFSWLTKKKHWLYNLECLNFILPLGFILFVPSFYSTNTEHVVYQTSYQKLGVHVWIVSSGTRLWAAFWKKSVSAETCNMGGG